MRLRSQYGFMIGMVVIVLIMLNLQSNLKEMLLKRFSNGNALQNFEAKPKDLNRSEISSRLLLIYKKQWTQYRNAKFMPEIHDQHLNIRIKFNDSIDFNINKNQSQLNISIICRSKSTRQILLIMPIVLILKKTNVIRVDYHGSSINPSPNYSFNTSTNTFNIRAPFMITPDMSYLFSLRYSNEINETTMNWPVWPLSSKCIEQYQSHLSVNKYHIDSQLNCSFTSYLEGQTQKQIFLSEKTIVSQWLDIVYGASIQENTSINRRKHSFEQTSNISFCPVEFQNWINEYQVWHANISRLISQPNLTVIEQRNLILELDVKFLFMVRFESGTSDRLIHLIASYLVAILTKRFYVFDNTWPEFFEMFHSNLAFRPEIITPWSNNLTRLNENLNNTDPLYFTNKWQITNAHRCTTDFNYDALFPERILYLKSHAGNLMQMLTSSSSFYSYFLKNVLKLRPDNIFGCLYHSLIIPRLSMFVGACSIVYETDFISSEKMLQTLLSPNTPTIGIQIRVGDTYLKETISNGTIETLVKRYTGFFNCARNISDLNGHTVSFLMADSLILREYAFKQWPYYAKNTSHLRIMTNSRQSKHITYTTDVFDALRDGLFDMFLYSLCDRHVLTLDSGFGRVPAFLSMKGQPFFTLNANHKPVCSTGEGQTDFITAGHQWSGV